MDQPRSIRTFNPGAMNYGPFARKHGAIGTDGRLAIFPDEDTGYKAMSSLLDVYGKRGQNTVSSIIGGLPTNPNLAWAPRGVDNNSTDTYIQKVASKLGIAPDTPITPELRPVLMRAMAEYEAGVPLGSVPRPASPATPVQTSSPTGQPAMTPYTGATPDDVSTQRKMAQALMGQGMSTEPVGHWTQALARVLQGGVGGMYQEQARTGEKSRQDALAQALSGSGTFGGLSAGDRAIMTQNPEIMQSVATKAIGSKFDANAGKTEGIKEYEYAVRNGFKGTLQDWMISRRATQGEYNKNPIFGTRTGPDGKPQTVMLQAGSRGDAAETKLPEGVSVNAQKPIEVDAGTHTVLLDPITRQPIAQIPKNLAAASGQKAEGAARGQARVDLPTVQSTADNVIKYIESIETDPNLNTIIGAYGGRAPNFSTGARTAQSKIDQLNSQAFLIAFERLKGAGAITEREGAAAAQALTRLKEQVQDPKDYQAALKDFKNEVYRLVETAKRKAGVGGPSGNAGFAGESSGGWSAKRLD